MAFKTKWLIYLLPRNVYSIFTKCVENMSKTIKKHEAVVKVESYSEKIEHSTNKLHALEMSTPKLTTIKRTLN